LFPVSFFRPSHNNKERVSVFQNQQETSKKILEEDDRLIMKSVKCVCVCVCLGCLFYLAIKVVALIILLQQTRKKRGAVNKKELTPEALERRTTAMYSPSPKPRCVKNTRKQTDSPGMNAVKKKTPKCPCLTKMPMLQKKNQSAISLLPPSHPLNDFFVPRRQ